MNTTDIGNTGEQLAAEELARQGYEIIERNWKTKWSEVDIIAKNHNIIYFIEVKFCQSSRQGDGFDYITDQKLHHMQRAAELWVSVHNWQGEYQLMGVSVLGESKKIDIREIE